jgi:hypothetical protein
MWRLIRLAFQGWRGQQQGTVNRLPQAKSCLNISPQVGHHYLLIHNAIRSSPSTVSGQRDVNNAIRESECGGYFIKNEWSMRNVANGDYGPLLGARVGLVCHDGSFQLWEWNSERNSFTALRLEATPPKAFRRATTATDLTAPGFRPRFLTLPDNTRNIIAFELQMWKRGFRKSSPDAMALIAKQLDDQQLAPIAAYYQQVLTVPWSRSNR